MPQQKHAGQLAGAFPRPLPPGGYIPSSSVAFLRYSSSGGSAATSSTVSTLTVSAAFKEPPTH